MKILTDKPNKRPFLILICLVILALILCGVYWIYTLRVAHSSFENYYNFRGCVQLLEKTDTYGICKLSSGKIIEIVEYQNKWFLDGDLPSGASDPSVVYINTEYGFTFSIYHTRMEFICRRGFFCFRRPNSCERNSSQ